MEVETSSFIALYPGEAKGPKGGHFISYQGISSHLSRLVPMKNVRVLLHPGLIPTHLTDFMFGPGSHTDQEEEEADYQVLLKRAEAGGDSRGCGLGLHTSEELSWCKRSMS